MAGVPYGITVGETKCLESTIDGLGDFEGAVVTAAGFREEASFEEVAIPFDLDIVVKLSKL